MGRGEKFFWFEIRGVGGVGGSGFFWPLKIPTRGGMLWSILPPPLILFSDVTSKKIKICHKVSVDDENQQIRT